MKIDTGRLQRAIWLEAKPIDLDTWRVRGGTRDHMVTVESGRCFCDCADAAARDGDSCKHSLLVRLRAGDKEVVRALRALVLAPDSRSARRRRGYNCTHAPESPNSGGTGPDSRQAGSRVGPGAAIAGHRGAQYR